MSRHRAVKNLDLADELDDGAFDGNDDYYEDMTSEQQGPSIIPAPPAWNLHAQLNPLRHAAQMAHAFSQVQAVLGTDSPISDKQIRDALWDSYFDVDGSIAHLLDEQHKKEVRKQKEQGEAPSLQSPPSPPPPAEGDLVENSGADTDMHEGPALTARDGTDALPPTAELASLSLRTPSSSSASADGQGGSPAPAPKNKLAAKMAANKAKRSLAVPPPAPAAVGAGAADGVNPQPAAESAAAAQQQQQPEKKLSKLQQKMLAAKAAKATAAAANAGAGAGAVPVPAKPGATDVSSPSAADQPPTASSEEETPDALPTMVLDGLPPRTSAAAATATAPDLALSASPSAFASALAPAAVVVTAVPALSTMLAPLATPVLFGPSPDDKVLEARKGTALAGAGAGTGSRTNGTGTGSGAGGPRRPIGVAVPGAGRR
ncbi:hypothetical protein C6P46_004024 [Rhodotorula mucilaginosa]|uniref:HBS1-like protein N-terminal domain-containing protein n=1 Tax=Rhodotorula mucilaginosa TaxID=5537 RepID=A0A9P6W1X3_RHOMI|nr:hypothetical protein C6P46_004024 [Rhodotorula mucilaginosa]